MTQFKQLRGVVVTTARPHGISGWFRPKIVFWGTGCSCGVEGAAWEVRVVNAMQLLLCDTESISPGSLEASQGFCHLVRPGCMIWASVLGVPVFLAALLQVLLLCFSFHFNAQLVLAAPAITLALCTYAHQVTQARNPLHQSIQLYRERMKTHTAIDHSGTEVGASRSVHFCNLQEFYSTFEMFILQRDMYYVARNIIMPLTRPSRLSFAEMTGPCSAHFYFVSHTWHWEFHNVMTCLYQHGEGNSRYWMDVFSFNHHRNGEEQAQVSSFEASFHKALSSPLCQGVVVPFPHAAGLGDYLSRSWCLLELFMAFRQSNDVENVDAGIERVSFCAPSGALNRGRCSPDLCMECLALLSNLNFRDATANSQEDMMMIAEFIQDIGWEEIHRILRRSFKKIIESVEGLATLHAERVKSQLLLRNFSQLLQRRGSNTSETCHPGPERSISAGQLDELQSFFATVLDNRDMYWVCDEIVKPLTREKQVSYAELVGCGMVRWFISHWWGMHFNLTVRSILNHAKEQTGEDVRYWVCTFSNNQWKMSEEIPPLAPPSESSFYKALRSPSCLGSCMILDERVVPLSRAWCLFELLQTFLIQDEVPSRESLNILTSSGVMNSGKCSIDTAMAIGKQLTILNLQDAGASKDADKRLIFTAVERAGGFAAINAKLKLRIRKVIGVVANQFDQDLRQLHVELGKHKVAAFCWRLSHTRTRCTRHRFTRAKELQESVAYFESA